MSVPDVMWEGYNLNILSITVQNLHNVRVWFIALKYKEFVVNFQSYDVWFQIHPKFLPLFEELLLMYVLAEIFIVYLFNTRNIN
jgi:hypothetical protein